MLRLRTFGGLWIESADGARRPSPKPRRLALLAILAAAGSRGITRNRLRALFWPDANDKKTSHALSQTLYALRQDLGPNVIRADTDLRLDPETIASDTEDFRDAVTRADWSAACQLYQGPFAAGFSLEDSPEFDRWLEGERTALLRQAEAAFQALAEELTAVGDLRRAAEIGKRLSDLDPLSARLASSYMTALAAIGDRAGAVAHAKAYSATMRRDLEADPDPLVVALADRLRREMTVARAAVAPSQPPLRDPITEVASSPRRVRRSLGWTGVVIGVVLALAAAAAAVRSNQGAARPPVLAVGQIRDLTAPDSAQLGGALSEVVATSLGRLAEVDVIANSRILELLERGADTIRAARTEAARRAGATEVLEGELTSVSGGQLRLDFRRIDIGRGRVRRGYSVSGSDRFALIDSLTSLVAADLRIGPPVRPLSDFTPRSPIALRLYEEGLRAFYQSDFFAAQRLFQDALSDDSTFALAAYYAYRASRATGGADPSLEALALRLAARATDRDRLLILTSIRQAQNDPTAPLFADTLAARFPNDPEALLRAAEGSTIHKLIGPRERDWLERAIAIDSASGANSKAPCRLCNSLNHLSAALQWADSGLAAERVVRRHINLRPGDSLPVRELAMHQFFLGRPEEAARNLAKSAAPSPYHLFLGRLLTGQLEEADAECTVQLHQDNSAALGEYRWLCAILWRYQGRYQDAAALIYSDRLPGGGQLPGPHQRDRVGEAVLDLEMGRPTLALRTLETMRPVDRQPLTPGRFARGLTWNLALRGTAAAMDQEYELTRRLADSAEAVGRGSLYGRDRLLHFFLRGLIASASGDHQTAVDFFRRSIFSWTFGYTRANLELARSLLALGRPAEAIAPLQAALRGAWDGSNLYVSRTELHEALAQAFAASARPDSAKAHFEVVERSWRRADPSFAARYRAARDWLGRRTHDNR